MAISDKTRKILWGRSGNRCAICRQILVIDETAEDAHSVVGDECHIHSGAVSGPRHVPELDASTIDQYENLLLLCRVHHKMVDDQFDTYSGDLLRSIKTNHEKWVNEKFEDNPSRERTRLVRIAGEVPTHLRPIESGHELFQIAATCDGYYFDYCHDLTSDEVELVGSFVQNLNDWANLAGGLEPIERMRAGGAISEQMDKILKSGFRVFVARERQELIGGVGAPSSFHMMHVAVVRERDPQIVTMDDHTADE